MKIFFGGGAAIAGALLGSSFLVFTPTSIAEPLQKQDQNKTKSQEQPDKPSQDKISQGTKANPGASADSLDRGAEITNLNAQPAGAATKAAEAVSEKPDQAQPTPSPSVSFTATAYSLYGRTASGAQVRKGIIAADRTVLPIGTKVKIESGNYTGEYEVCDTGGAVRGKRIDVWVPSGREAMRFGRRNVKLTVLSYPKTADRRRRARTR